VNEEHDIEGSQTSAGQDFGCEEVSGPKHVVVPANELGASDAAFAFGCCAQTVSFQNIADGLVVSVKIKIGQCADDAIIAPGWILAGELEYPLFNLGWDEWPSRFGDASAGKIPLAGDQAAMPFEHLALGIVEAPVRWMPVKQGAVITVSSSTNSSFWRSASSL
jgi:hypothetical protein